MTLDESDALAMLISQTWRVNTSVWSDALMQFDADLAAETYVRMRDTWTEAPPFAAFRAEYRAMHAPKLVRFYERCGMCDDTGWITGTSTREGHGEFSCAQPCRCSRGHQYEQGFEAAIEFNRTQRRAFS